MFLLNIRSADCKPRATHFKDLDDYLISTCSWDVPWQKPVKLTARHKTSAYFPAGFTRPAFSKAKRSVTVQTYVLYRGQLLEQQRVLKS